MSRRRRSTSPSRRGSPDLLQDLQRWLGMAILIITHDLLLVAAAILAVYIVLGMLYESYVHPIAILSALPSTAGVGALLMLMLFHYDLSVIALIGIILLIGIVKKNAIMMIEAYFVALTSLAVPGWIGWLLFDSLRDTWNTTARPRPGAGWRGNQPASRQERAGDAVSPVHHRRSAAAQGQGPER
jgi:hypothetical protein